MRLNAEAFNRHSAMYALVTGEVITPHWSEVRWDCCDLNVPQTYPLALTFARCNPRAALLKLLLGSVRYQSMPYKRGTSGNPAGRPKGARDSRSLLFDELVPHGHALISKAVAAALDGDPMMIKLCIDKLIANPKPREQSVKIDRFEGSLSEKGDRILQAISGWRDFTDRRFYSPERNSCSGEARRTR